MCLTLCNSVDCSPPGSSISDISWARIPEWVSISFSKGSSGPQNWILVSYIGRWIIYHWTTREAMVNIRRLFKRTEVKNLSWIIGKTKKLSHYPSLGHMYSILEPSVPLQAYPELFHIINKLLRCLYMLPQHRWYFCIYWEKEEMTMTKRRGILKFFVVRNCHRNHMYCLIESSQ